MTDEGVDSRAVQKRLMPLIEVLPASVATLTRSERTEGFEIELAPAASDVAPLAVSAPDGGAFVTVSFGHHSFIEVMPTGWRATPLPTYLDEVEALVAAVVAGKCRETLWLNHSEQIVRSRGVVELASGPVETSHRSSSGGRAARQVERQYSPYSAG
jgi:hypothetical protein